MTTLDGTVRSVATWRDSAVVVPDEVEARLRTATVDLEGSRRAASETAAAALREWRPRERFRLLSGVGTASTSRRLGLALATIRPGLDIADAVGVPCFLETAEWSNVGWYARVGFEVVGRRTIPDGGPEVWAMRRPPVVARGSE